MPPRFADSRVRILRIRGGYWWVLADLIPALEYKYTKAALHHLHCVPGRRSRPCAVAAGGRA